MLAIVDRPEQAQGAFTDLATQRLQLRPFMAADAERLAAMFSNWNLARMLRTVEWPATAKTVADWLVDGEVGRLDGSLFRFAIVFADEAIGCVDLTLREPGKADLGVWLDEAFAGKGFATEAATAVIVFAFNVLELTALNAYHAADRLTAGKLLASLGFRNAGFAWLHAKSRGETVLHRRYILRRPPQEDAKPGSITAVRARAMLRAYQQGRLVISI